METNNKCNAVTIKGEPCARGRNKSGFCTVHEKCRTEHGPHEFEKEQLKFRFNKANRELTEKYREDMRTIPDTERPIRNLQYMRDRGVLRANHLRDVTAMAERHRQEIEETGVNPDAEAIARKEAKARAKAEKQRRDMEARDRRIAEGLLELERIHAENDRWQQEFMQRRNHVYDPVVFAPAEPVVRDLRDIAGDRQNIHTTEAVNHTKSIIEKIRKVEVPEDYRWDPENCSKTPGEIIAECRLSQKAAHQMMSQYAQDTSIYDIEAGIYGKVLDSVWQFIKNHEDRADLIGILRSELQDNIGMCAQGNLTRICNIVAGYVDGVTMMEPLAEKLGRLLAPLMDVEDALDRIAQAEKILEELNVPAEERDTWMEPLKA